MSNKVKVTKESMYFYSMIGMLECARLYHEEILKAEKQVVHQEVKMELKKLFRNYDRFISTVTGGLPPALKQGFLDEWVNRDYVVYASVFERMADMSDEQRNILEEFSQDLLKGEVKVIHK